MWRWLSAALVMVAVAAAWVLALPPAPVRQPMDFAHAKHGTMGCAVCHHGADTMARAGIPSVRVCAKCHATAPGGQSAVWDAALRDQIGWVQVAHVPDHVLFSHRRHVALARLDCASCHGNVRERTTPVTAASVRLEMDSCVACHRREGAAEDCAACHR